MTTRPRLPRDLLAVLASLDDPKDLNRLLSDLFTASEIQSIRERWTIVKLLAGGESQRRVRDRVGVSVATVSRGSRQLQYGSGGFQLAFDTLAELELPHPGGNAVTAKRGRK